jgi:hypothetical protein
MQRELNFLALGILLICRTVADRERDGVDMKTAWGAVALTVLLSGCAYNGHPTLTDKVKTAAEAIELGKKVCRSPNGGIEGHWQAEFHDGVWRVRHIFFAGDWEEANIRAADGESTDGLCAVVVTAT